MISYLCLTSKAGMAFATALQSPHCQLEYLDLSFVWGASFMGVWGGLREAAGLAVAQSLSSKHCKLTYLDISHSGLSDSVGIAIATSFFTRTSRIRTLKVSGNGKHQHMSDTVFGVGAAVAMARALRSEWCKLTNLDISYNLIGDAAAITIAHSLKSNHCALASLDISDNNLSDAAGMAFAKALVSRCSLTSLNISENSLTGKRYLMSNISISHSDAALNLRPHRRCGCHTFRALAVQLQTGPAILLL